MSADDENAAAPAAPAPKTNKILPLIVVLNTLLLAGVLVFVMKRPAAQAAGEAAKPAASAPAEHGAGGGSGSEHGDKEGDQLGPVLRLDNFIVQVRTTEGDRYAHLTIEVELRNELDKKAFETRMPRIRDAVIGYLSDRTEDDLRGSEGLSQLKEALAKKMDEIVPGRRTRGLFITEFIIQ